MSPKTQRSPAIARRAGERFTRESITAFPVVPIPVTMVVAWAGVTVNIMDMLMEIKPKATVLAK